MTTQYRITVFGEITVTDRRPRRTRVVECAWFDWNRDQRQERLHARLRGSGSFYYGGLPRAYRRAAVVMRQPGVRQVKIETIGGKAVARLMKSGDSFYCLIYDDEDRKEMYR